ncbi:hypothetical protein AGMMS49991_00230 [Spirochaetia bacterium]|nr:hypothetical protein AGMMS49991_00230 [Spirochaetia bacterium]
MGIFDRLGDVIKSYINDGDTPVFSGQSQKRRSNDPDLDAAFDELNDFLGGGKGTSGGDAHGNGFGGNAWGGGNGGFGDTRTGGASGRSGAGQTVPESLRGDFAELGVNFGASSDECKAAYKKLLKIHHPDRHAGHPGNMEKATKKSARINAAFDRIEKWRGTGRAD